MNMAAANFCQEPGGNSLFFGTDFLCCRMKTLPVIIRPNGNENRRRADILSSPPNKQTKNEHGILFKSPKAFKDPLVSFSFAQFFD